MGACGQRGWGGFSGQASYEHVEHVLDEQLRRLVADVVVLVIDQDIPVDDDGYWTVVVSRAEDRPANATADCGVAWLEASPDDDTILVYRHMLPDPSFDQAIQHVGGGSEEEQMGDYYPTGTYGAVADHERLGCAQPTDTGDELTTDDDQASAAEETTGDTSNTPLMAGIAALAMLVGAVAGALALGIRHRRRH